ncbi:DUF2634 domain-containing protein [Anaerovibrio slackiae]|uniref:DUF2634 domain-containing protein n=1 Tax=Anaerovibrio slackiae TaxID=2652309 RepID=UPI00386655D8
MAEMQFLPQTGDDIDLMEFAIEEQPSYTYKLDIDKGRIRGMTDEADAMLQAVYLILSVERYQYPIYSFNYGVELADLIGQPKDYVMSEAKRRITEALTQDDRIESVDGWAFETTKKSVIVTFTVHTIFGDIETTKEVAV